MSSTEIVTLPGVGNEYSLTRFMPRDLTELVRFSEYASKSGVFGTLTPSQALIVMLQGAELGINPLQALREIPLVNGKPRPSATLVAGLIQRSPLCEDWSLVSSPTNVTLKAKRKGRGSEFIVNVGIEDVPAALRSKDVWKQNPEDMLVARAIHRMARRAFADILAGIQDQDEIDETRVIDVAKVERQTAQTDYPRPHRINLDDDENLCHGSVWLHANSTGGAFLACNACTATFSPPQEVRDLIRGTPEHLTIAGASEPALEPGERTPTPEEIDEVVRRSLEGATITAKNVPADEYTGPFTPTFNAPESAVQSEYEDATLDGEDVVVVPASAEAPIPTPDGPESAEERHLAMRNAIYSHWIMPRPTANKIEMRQLLEDFGWDGGETLGDWMLHLDELKLAAVADGVAGIA